jgi:adenosylmethionine---8-amino-7-oxononanoate aminotransferase
MSVSEQSAYTNSGRTLKELDQACLWHPYTQMQTAVPPLPVVRGKGVYLYTEDGRRILDGISSWWVNIHGHSHPKLNEALSKQASELEHVMFAGITHRPAVALAQQLLAVLPSNLKRIFYSDNGSTAVEVALKMSFQFWQNRGETNRRTFIVLDRAYHGDTVGAMSASAESPFTAPFQALLFQVQRVHSPYCYRCPLGLERSRCTINCLASLEQALMAAGDTVAGVLVEPMLQGAGGMIMWPQEFLSGVRRLCDRYNTLMIADEVLTGFGRTGKMFACEHQEVKPDIICLSKALTAGYLPLGVTACTARIYEAFLSSDPRKTFFHGHSFTANPLACAVALASLELFDTEQSLNRVRRIESIFLERLPLPGTLPHVGDVRILGGVAALELVYDLKSRVTEGYLDRIGPYLTRSFLDRGLLLRPLGNVLYLMPPYVITEDELHWVIDQVEQVLTHLRWTWI